MVILQECEVCRVPARGILQRGSVVVALGRATIAICQKKSWQCGGQYRQIARRLVLCIKSARLQGREEIIPGEIYRGGVVLMVGAIVDETADGEFLIEGGYFFLVFDGYLSRWYKEGYLLMLEKQHPLDVHGPARQIGKVVL